MLPGLEGAIQKATACCPDKAKQVQALFDKWVIGLSTDPMPMTPDGIMVAQAFGRQTRTTLYSNTLVTSGLLAHEFIHVVPQNVHKQERMGEQLKPWAQRSFEIEAVQLAQMILRGQSICDLLTGEPLGPDPVEQYYRNYDPRPLWKRWLNIR
jgi:hypothetical protein